ncbi:septal ring lytic transglycosylase RlpA family protein [Flavobacterium terrigena]|uniref:Probable endolytic peptidoglycan transglycosylase RlpA n=1 Tax=Flavobacterium terrigena TaxID=402734 RepID=A0A1H6Y9Z0_9FLAO|nr:septal ring lytic transglycosylase RlpA family protein [Flavobacterium terrigena]SEJ34012.1 rare lipoprotein A [Flavobacterium terrigena]
MISLTKKFTAILLLLSFTLLMSSCGSSKSKTDSSRGTTYKSKGVASYYHDKFNGKKTASGERFSNKEYTAAHKNLPFGTKVRVTNLENGKSVIVAINDRGPFSKGREIDLSKKAFMEISDKKTHGELSVKIEVLK